MTSIVIMIIISTTSPSFCYSVHDFYLYLPLFICRKMTNCYCSFTSSTVPIIVFEVSYKFPFSSLPKLRRYTSFLLYIKWSLRSNVPTLSILLVVNFPEVPFIIGVTYRSKFNLVLPLSLQFLKFCNTSHYSFLQSDSTRSENTVVSL